MTLTNCPGSSEFKRPVPESIICSACGAEVEIWSDEVQTACPSCGKTVLRVKEGVRCLDWCKSAKMCVGESAYNQFLANKNITMKEKITREMEDYFGPDARRIAHAKNVLGFAEEILKREKADWHIVVPAALLHDIGIKLSEEKYGSSAARHQEKEGPPVARAILEKVGVKKEDIDEICEIIAHHHTPGVVRTMNFSVLYDADWLENLKDDPHRKTRLWVKKRIGRSFMTAAGRALAERLYLQP